MALQELAAAQASAPEFPWRYRTERKEPQERTIYVFTATDSHLATTTITKASRMQQAS